MQGLVARSSQSVDTDITCGEAESALRKEIGKFPTLYAADCTYIPGDSPINPELQKWY